VGPSGSGGSATGRGEEGDWRSGGQKVRVLELGVWEGNSAAWLVSHVAFQEGAELVCVDTFAGGHEHVTCPTYSRELEVAPPSCGFACVLSGVGICVHVFMYYIHDV